MSAFQLFFRFILSKRAGSLVRRISWLSITGVAVASGAFVLIMSVMSGLNGNIHKRILKVEPHMVLNLQLPNKQAGKDLTNLENHPDWQKLKKFDKPGNKLEIRLVETQDVILRTVDGFFRGAEARGIDRESLSKILQDIYGGVDEIPGKGEIWIGADLARTLGVFEGDFILVIPPETLLLPQDQMPVFEKVRVAKILRSNVAEVDNGVLFYQRGLTLENFTQSASRKIGLEMRAPDPFDLSKYKKVLPEIQTWQDRNSALFHALKIEKIVIAIFLLMSGLIATFSVFTVLILLISQKKKDSAVLMALGCSRRGLKALYTRVGLILGCTGMVGGALVGLALSLYIEAHPIKVLPDIYYDTDIPAKVDLLYVALSLIVGLTIVALGSHRTAQVVDSLNLTEALKEKA